jgi:hypothetical protein
MNHRVVHQSNGAGPAAPGQVWLHLARSGPTTTRYGRSLARLGRTTAGRNQARASHSWPEPAAAGHSRPHLARARPGRTSKCARTY